MVGFREHLNEARSTLVRLHPTTDILQHVELRQDLGFFSWFPSRTGVPLLETGKSAKRRAREAEEATEAETPPVPPVKELAEQQLAGLLLDGEPDLAIDPTSALTLPITWLYGPDQPKDSATLGAFPNSDGFATALYVAQHRGLCQADRALDFMFGGSTLKFFALQKNPDMGARYLLQKHGGTLFVKKAISPNGLYTQHFHEQPFQFERLVTGRPMGARHGEKQDTHIQAMSLFNGKYRVLFAAEADARDVDGNTVEVKCGRRTGEDLAAVFFQMLSNGSAALYTGVSEGAKWHLLQDLEGEEKLRVKEQLKKENKLVAVDVESFADVAGRVESCHRVGKWTHNIQYAMETLAAEAPALREGALYKLGFSGKTLHVTPASAPFKPFLPPPEVMDSMLKAQL